MSRAFGFAMARAAAGVALLLSCGAAGAHTDQVSTGGFMAGYLHPLTGLDHTLAMLAIGLWAAARGGRTAWALPAAFLAAMAAGAALGIEGVPLPYVEPGIAASVIVLGLAATAARWTPLLLAAAVAAAFGLLHGHAHGTELPGSAGPLHYGAGFLAAAVLLVLAGSGLGGAGRSRWWPMACGVAVAVAGVWMALGTPGVG